MNYDAAGSKHSKVSPEETREYLTVAEFVDGEIEAIHHPEGRVVFMDGVVEYEYSIRDHLGNTRVSFIDLDDDGIIDPKASGDELVQENHYYPFGLNIQNPNYANSADPKNNYQYNGKELVDDLGLGWMDYGARWYDPSIGRWGQIDPMAETDHSVGLTPYHYVANNPINGVDPDGQDYVLTIDMEKETATISATLFVESGDEASLKSAQVAADFWNQESGNFDISIGNKDNKSQFVLNFEIQVKESDNARAEANKSDGNFYEVVPDESMPSEYNEGMQATETPSGITTGGNHIRVAKSQAESTSGAHEVGHALGIEGHTNGIMGTIRSNNNRVTGTHIGRMVRNAGRGQNTDAGIGIVRQIGTSYSFKSIRKAKAFKHE